MPASESSAEPVVEADVKEVEQVAETDGLRTHPLTGLLQGILWTGAALAAMASTILQNDLGDVVPRWVQLLAIILGALAIGEAVGFLRWFFLRYVIDDTELRIESGILTKKSRRMPFERIQSVDIAEPLLARVVGLSELRIDMAGGGESRTALRFLSLSDARALRRLLLARAHGRTLDESAEAKDSSADPDLDDEGELIAHVTPDRVLVGTLLSVDFLAVIGLAIVFLLAAIGLRQPLVVLGGAVPVVFSAFSIISRRVIAQWDFTLRRTSGGLRIQRGLLSRTSQTIPFSRVQGVVVEEPIVWRRLGWQRLEVDVAGYAGIEPDRNQNVSTLLPIADPALTAHVVEQLIPGQPPTEVTRVGRRSRWFAPVGWRYRWIGAGDRTVVSSTGWLTRGTHLVPHHKAQSVAIEQGPLQRVLGLATVNVHTPPGPVDVTARNLDGEAARSELIDELARARAARA